jgi:hypothetical protein
MEQKKRPGFSVKGATLLTSSKLHWLCSIQHLIQQFALEISLRLSQGNAGISIDLWPIACQEDLMKEMYSWDLAAR